MKAGKHKQSTILKKFAVTRYGKPEYERFYHVENVPPSVAKRLLTGHPNVDPDERQNYSPKMKDMVKITKKHGGVLIGYVVPPASGREDVRITFEGFILPVSKSVAQQVVGQVATEMGASEPDEFFKTKDGWRFWWD